jgi:hypothetical protein
MFTFSPRTSYTAPYDPTTPDSLDTLERIARNQATTAMLAGIITPYQLGEFLLALSH